MIRLQLIDFNTVQHFFVDYQKKAKNYEMPPEEAEFLGIYRGEELIGYFATVGYEDKTLEINQGYLKPTARHQNLSRISLKLLEEQAKKVGMKQVILATNRAVGSYIRFMRKNGYEPSRVIFSKDI